MPVKNAPCLNRPRLVGVAPEVDRNLKDAADRHSSLTGLVHRPWLLRVDHTSLIVRGASPRDLPGVAAMHTRCSAQTLLDRFRAGGRPPAVASLEMMLRRPLTFVVTTREGSVVAMASATIDQHHDRGSCDLGMLVEDSWQTRGIGRELITHVAGAALVVGYTELVAYTATSVVPAQRLLLEVGHTRVVNDPQQPHLHTYLPEAAALGLGAVRERLAS